MERKALVKAAKELNNVLGLEPEIDTKQAQVLEKLKEDIMAAAELLEPEDELSDATRKVIEELEGAQEAPGPEDVTQEDAEEEPLPKAKEVTATLDAQTKSQTQGQGKAIPRYEGGMTQFIDNHILAGGDWETILKKTQKEAEKRGIDPKKYSVGTLRQHVKYRIKHGFPIKGRLEVEMTDKGVRVGKGE